MNCSQCNTLTSEGREYFIEDRSTGYREEGFACLVCLGEETEIAVCDDVEMLEAA